LLAARGGRHEEGRVETLGEAGSERDLERELVERYPDLALLLRRAATMHAWQPSRVGERVLRRLAGAVALVLERRLPADEAERFMAEVAAETQGWLDDQRRDRGRTGTRERLP
jgi:hypothetical protein